MGTKHSDTTLGSALSKAPSQARTPVLIDALSARLGGGLSYLVPQLRALEKVAPHLDLRVLAAPANYAALREALASPVSVLRTNTARPLFEQTVLAIPRRAGEVLYCPGSFSPILAPRRSTVLAVQNPNYFGSGRRAPHNRRIERRLRGGLSRLSAQRAGKVIVISQSLLDEMRLDLPEVADRAVLIQSGAPEWPDESLAPPSLPHEICGFILAIANDAPHKHLDLTVDAWVEAFLDTRLRDRVPPLVVAGGYFTAQRRDAQRLRVPSHLRSRFVQIGAVTDRRHVRWLFENALAMVASATLEAHPLTPAEAGSLGCPLVLSDIPAHREVAEAHATFVRSGSRRELASAIRDISPPNEIERHNWTWPVTWQDNARSLACVLMDARQ